MYIRLLVPLFSILVASATRAGDVVYLHPDRAELGMENLHRRQAPTAFTTERTANTEFAPPQTVTPPDPSATGTQTTTHEANTEIIPATTTGPPPPLVTTDSRSANTQAVGPSTISSALAMPTGIVRMDAALGAVAFGLVMIG